MGQAVRLLAKADSLDSLVLALAPIEALTPSADECLVEILAAAVNPSDVKAALGVMPQAVWPRTPGRDFAGIVRAGPSNLLGVEVWGSGGDLGITRDGTHASHLLLPVASVRAKPANLTSEEAAGVGVPFCTAALGFAGAGGARPGDVVLVLGANGKVGQAAIQLAGLAGARSIAVERRGEGYLGHAAGPVDAIDARSAPIAEAVRELTAGHGADLIFNTVGSPYFEDANKALAQRGRHVLISTVERSVPFDIFAFYRGEHRMIGVDSLKHDARAAAALLDGMRDGFERGRLRPFPVSRDAVYPLARARDAYRAVLAGTRARILLNPRG